MYQEKKIKRKDSIKKPFGKSSQIDLLMHINEKNWNETLLKIIQVIWSYAQTSLYPIEKYKLFLPCFIFFKFYR